MRGVMQKTMRIQPIVATALLSLTAAGFFLTHSGVALHAQSAAPGQAADDVTYHSGSYRYLLAPHTMEFYHGVRFGQGDATMSTDNAVILLDKDNNLLNAKAPGPVHLYDPQDDLIGQHGTVDFTKHLATLHDNIVLVVKPGKREASAADSSPRRQFKDPATLTCQMMTYDYRFKVGKIPGPLTVTQVIQTKENGLQTRTLTADAGLYDGRKQTIQLVGDIKGTYSDGSKIEGDTRLLGIPVVINIKEGAEGIFVSFPSHGVFPVKPQAKGQNDASADEEPDLTLPIPPPHIPTSADTRAASTQAPASQTPTPTPAPATSASPVPAQTPPAVAPPTAASPAGTP